MTVTLRGSGGIELAADVTGRWDGPLVLLLHGGGQTRHSWGGTSRVLAAQGLFTVAVDLRGHGDSDWAPDGDYSIDAYVADLRSIFDQFGRPAALVGASLGGITSLVAAGEKPVVDATALVLVDVAPRMSQDGRDRIGAFMRAHPEGFGSVEEAADVVSAYLPHRPRPKDVSGLARNLRLGADGRYHWHWDPAFLSAKGPGEQAGRAERFEEAAARVSAPMLLVRGGISEVVTDEDANSLLRVAPQCSYVDVPKAGHMVAGDQNDMFTSAVVEFLASHLR